MRGLSSRPQLSLDRSTPAIVGYMCRSIKTLRRPDEVATDSEIEAAALQFVRKVSGYRKPSRANEDAFDAAVRDVARASRRLLDAVGPGGARTPS